MPSTAQLTSLVRRVLVPLTPSASLGSDFCATAGQAGRGMWQAGEREECTAVGHPEVPTNTGSAAASVGKNRNIHQA